MSLPLPNLDDRTFTDLSVEMRSLIQRYDKAWTNHNTSDPGITLIELLAWLAEMLIYRMNRVDDRNYLTFLELIGIRPSGPQTMVTFEISIPQTALPANFVLPRGTRVAARDERSGRDIVFETIADVAARNDDWDDVRHLWVFKVAAVNTESIESELVGFSTGAPRQGFSLKQKPVFVVQEQESDAANPRVTVQVAGSPVAWTYKADLLSSGPTDEHFTIEPLIGLIRFGDGNAGKIPPSGARLTCSYRRFGGSAGNIPAGQIDTLVDPFEGIDPAVVSVANAYAATGGADGETVDDLLTRGLASLLEPYRAVSDEDFEFLTLRAAPDKVARVNVVADRNLAGTTPEEEGHVSIIILPAIEQLGVPPSPADYDAAAHTFILNRTVSGVTTALAGHQVARLKKEILRYLDERRLITTAVHVVDPPFTGVHLNLSVGAKPGVNSERVKEAVGKAIAAFLDPYAGWEDHTGWPHGRNVYRSELYQLIEAIEGVDHVVTLAMNGDTARSSIAIGENDLVAVDDLTVTIT
jgi:baseplate J-like protein